MKYLSFDLGLSHTGVAISYEGKIAMGLSTINTNDFHNLLRQIINLIAQHQPDEVIFGSPGDGPVVLLANDLNEQLQRELNITAILVDEDFTTKIAKKALFESGISRKKRESRDHQAAAAAILQSYLDGL